MKNLTTNRMSWSKTSTLLLQVFMFFIVLMPLRQAEAQDCDDINIELVYTGSTTLFGNTTAQCFEFRFVNPADYLETITSLTLSFTLENPVPPSTYFLLGGYQPVLDYVTASWQQPAHTNVFSQGSAFRFEAYSGNQTTFGDFSQANNPFLKLTVVTDDEVCIRGGVGLLKFHNDAAGQEIQCNLNEKMANLRACSMPPSEETCGQIITRWNCSTPNATTGYLSDVAVRIENINDQSLSCDDLSDNLGMFCCNAGENQDPLIISPFEDEDPLCGVNLIDLDEIQHWIAHITTNNDPIRFLAADVNYDGKVNVIDILHIRLLILGDYEIFPTKMNSWGFIDHETYVAIQNQISLFSIPAFNDYLNWSVGFPGIPTFHAYKLGDVDFSCTNCGSNNITGTPISSRNQETAYNINSKITNQEEIYSLKLSMNQTENIGLFSIEFSSDDIPDDLQIELHKHEIDPVSAYRIDRKNNRISILSVLDGFETIKQGEVICKINTSNRLFLENLRANKFFLSTKNKYYENVTIKSQHDLNNLRWVSDYLEFSSSIDGSSTIRYFDLSGRQLAIQSVEIQEGINNFPLPSNLGQGLFIARMTLQQSEFFTKIYR